MNIKLPADIQNAAQKLWNYHCIEKYPKTPVDIILALGSHDMRVAQHAANLTIHGVGTTLVVSGGSGKVTTGIWSKPEAEVFSEVASQMGVSSDKIIVEPQARNTGENITLSRDLLALENIEVKSGILVSKPYMRRRALATAEKQWPEVEWGVDSPSTEMLDYASKDTPLDRMLNLMVGDLQRLDLYAREGFQTHQDIPGDVWDAWKVLVDEGYDQFVIKSPKS